ncbi:hypothetical protein [Ehrlichia canis]|uniref:Uncharacterized protein n=1 Tax=Ehrlichia canis (strain Jake) TaxID=269484 RepID=A0ACA6AW60_EHRCJ|nr:hypothetical protein [Ehrlichia canis]AAZ68743.1 hypothetical protein Ecaj_0711 [Ehrlichia canis str. Jake]
MLTGKFKRNAFIRHEVSCLALFLKSRGFTSKEILGFLSVVQSFHQSTPSFIIYTGYEFNIVSEKQINFVVKSFDHRNYSNYQYILSRLDESGELDLVCQAYLWTIQMYALLRFYCYACQLQFGSECYSKDEMVDALLEDLYDLCAGIMTRGEGGRDQIPPDVLLPYVERFVSLVFKVDYQSLRLKLCCIVENAYRGYSEARAGVALEAQDKEKRMLVLVMYKTAMSEFVSINSDEFSSLFKKQIFPMTCRFICNGINVLPELFISRLGIECYIDVINFYKDLFFVFDSRDLYDVYQNEDEFCSAIFNDICLSARGSLAAVGGNTKSYNPYSYQMSVFAFYDISLAIHEIFGTKRLKKLLQLEYMLQLYKTLLAEDLNEMHVTLVTLLGRFSFYYTDENGENKCALELLLELMSLCYYAAFINRVPMEQVSLCYSVCYNMMSEIADSGNFEISLQEYRKVFDDVVAELHCRSIDLSEVVFEKNLFFILVQHLLCGEVLGKKLTVSGLTYDVLLECKKTQELKAQQASIMLCRIFKKSNGIIGSCSSNNIGGLLGKLLFGNFLERNLILKMLNIFHIAYKRSKNSHNSRDIQKNLSQELASYFSVVLNLLKYVEASLPYDFSLDSIDGLSPDHCEIYSNINNMLNICAESLGISLCDLEMEHDVKFEKDFADILGAIPISLLNNESDVVNQVSFCKDFDKETCMLIMQLVVSYVCLYDSSKVKEDLCSANLSSPAFLLFNILTYPGLSSAFVNLCYKTSLEKSIVVKRTFIEMLQSFSSEGMLNDLPTTEVENKIIAKGKEIITERLVKLLIREDMSFNINEEVLKCACLSIIKLRELSHADVELDMRNARNIARTSGVFIIDDSLLSNALSYEDKSLGIDQAIKQNPLFSQFFSSSAADEISTVDKILSELGDLAESKKLDTTSMGIIELSDVKDESTSTSSLIITDDKVAHKYEKLSSDFYDIDFESEIDKVEISKMKDGLKSYFDSDFYRKAYLEKKKESTSLFKMDVCVYSAPVIALTMGCMSVLLLSIAFASQENTMLFVSCVVIAVICLVISILCCCITAMQIYNQKDDVAEEETCLLERENIFTKTQNPDIFRVKPDHNKMH